MVGGISVRILCRQKMFRHVHGHVFWSSCLVVRVSFCHEVHVNPHSTISVSTHILSRNMTASLCRRPSGPKTKRTSVRPPKILLCGQQTQRCVVGSKMWPVCRSPRTDHRGHKTKRTMPCATAVCPVARKTISLDHNQREKVCGTRDPSSLVKKRTMCVPINRVRSLMCQKQEKRTNNNEHVRLCQA